MSAYDRFRFAPAALTACMLALVLGLGRGFAELQAMTFGVVLFTLLVQALRKKSKKLFADLRPLRLEMQIGNK